MLMSSLTDSGDNPSILKLVKWDHLPYHLKPSELSKVSLSPSRKMLLLLSYQSEALLLPLTTGWWSSYYLKDDVDRFCHLDHCQSPTMFTEFPTSTPVSIDIPAESFENPCEVSSASPGFGALISNVKSFAWGHYGDSYGHFEQSEFREFLTVCSDDGFTVHSFRYPNKDFVTTFVKESGPFNGDWVEWGPSSSTHADEQYLDVHGCENQLGDDKYHQNTLEQKKWLRTFLTEVDTSWHGSKYSARFPTKSSYPQSAAVVSFDISYATMNFLESCHTTRPFDETKRVHEILISAAHNPLLHNNKANLHSATGSIGSSYKFSRVFSGSLHNQLGLLLNSPEHAAVENELREGGNLFVAVIRLYHWGMEWVCKIDLDKPYHGPGPGFEWADFQFLDTLLVCLSTSGLTCIWCAKTGNPIACFDVVGSCKVDINVQSRLNQLKTPEADSLRSESMRTFKSLMVAPYSSLLAVADEHGVIYVVDADDHISGHLPNKIISSSQHSDLGMLASWNVASKGIGCQKAFADISNNLCLYDSEFLKGDLKSGNSAVFGLGKRVRHIIDKENWDGGRTGSNILSQGKIRIETSHSKEEVFSTPIRRIHLPPYHCGTEDYICFSPFGVTRLVGHYGTTGVKLYNCFHTDLHVSSTVVDDNNLDDFWLHKRCYFKKDIFVGESIGFSFKGILYVVTQEGLFVILPSVSFPCIVSSIESTRHWKPSSACSKYEMSGLLAVNKPHELWRPWQMEVFDKTLFFEGPEAAEAICLDNGWDLQVARLRRLQLGLHYLKFDEIKESLDMLVEANLAEEGILHLLFTSVYLLFCKVGNDNEASLASRFLALAACFATKMIRKYGSAEHKGNQVLSIRKDMRSEYIWKHQHFQNFCEMTNSRMLSDMSLLLEVIRNLQIKLSSKDRRLLLDKGDGKDTRNMVDGENTQNDSVLPFASTESVSLSMLNSVESQAPASLLQFNEIEDLALSLAKPSSSQVNLNEIWVPEVDPNARSKLLPLKNPKEIITRWKIDSPDLKTVVKEALCYGRLPLAVLQVHLQRHGDQMHEKECYDNFTEVCDIGRAIAYDLFLKGQSALAVETLLRLGEDIELILRQLLLGTVRRSLRGQIAKEMESYGYLKRQERKILEGIFLIERFYPSSNFWSTYHGKQKDSSVSSINGEVSKIELKLHVNDSFVIECGDIDGVVLGSWVNLDDDAAFSVVDEENVHGGYWACAAIWADAWDQRTIDRVVLDQPINMGVVVSWESQLEFHLSHNNIVEVHKLFDLIPPSFLSEETLKINLNHSSSDSGNDALVMGYSLDICASGEVEPVFLFFPNIKVFRFSAVYMCSSWLKVLVEQELARKYIFLKDYWESTAELVPLMGRAGLIINASKTSQFSDSLSGFDVEKVGDQAHNDTANALHQLIMHYCTQYNLPHFLDLYLDHHNLVFDDDTLNSLCEAAGDCQWAKWLLFLRVRGREHETSFFNARSNLSNQMAQTNKLNAHEVDEIIKTVDDMAEGGGEFVALATLMYESAPIQKCLYTGSVSRHCTSSSQCTLENLKPGLEKFPTLWRALVSACFGTDSIGVSTSSSPFFRKSAFSDYLRFRDSMFSSAGGDTSLVQMLPCWFPKSIRRLVRLFAQVPLGWQSLSSALTFGGSILYRESSYVTNANFDGINPVSWEATIQKSVEEELYSSIDEGGSGMEQHLHRGRALAAFNHLLSLRASKLKDSIEHREPLRQTNIQSDVQAILSPLSLKEWCLLPSIIQLAVMHFDDPALVASCTFLLELCGVSTSMLRIDIAALLRISDYYTSIRQNTHHDVSPNGSTIRAESHEGDITYSLARALADNYIHHDNLMALKQKEVHVNDSRGKQLLQPLLIVLQHLEKASLPSLEEGKTCGFWLSNGIGDGFEFRSQQKDASQHWKLVTEFCQIHHLPLSTKYLVLLANDNDWVGFLMEAQIRLFPTDTVINVAAKEFSNPRLKMHVLTVLKSMPTMRKKQNTPLSAFSGSNHVVLAADSGPMVPVELFGLLAMCERQKNPGEALLVKAKELRWSLLAMTASCFPDVSPLSCLTVWLEITAARETSSIKVNDISSKVTENVKAAVEATNALPSGSRTFSFHYNRRNSKRRRLLDPSSDSSPVGSSNISPTLFSMAVSVSEETVSNELETTAIPEHSNISTDPDESLNSLSNMVAVLCEQHLFLPLLRAFEMFLPSCALLPFIRSLQAFSQMRLSEASVHLTSFSTRVKDESLYLPTNIHRDGILKAAWISSTAAKAAEAMLSTCPSAYEKRCLLQLLAGTDFGDGGSTSIYFQRLHWKINLSEPSLRKDDDLYLGNEILSDDTLLAALENNGRWDQARSWARQLESAGSSWKYAAHHVTETQAEAMVAEWKEFLWDVPEERGALWSHCHTLFVRYSFPALQAGLFFLRHADAIEKEIPARELHEMLLFALQWLSGYITQIPPVYPLYLLREIETRVWLLAVESEAQAKTEGDYNLPFSTHNIGGGNTASTIEQTATIIEKMDGHVNATCLKVSERNGSRENCMQLNRPNQVSDSTNSGTMSCSTRTKRRTKNYLALKRPTDSIDTNNDSDDSPKSPQNRSGGEISKSSPLQEENVKIEASVSGWEEKVRPADMERAILSLLEFGQVTAAKQLQHKLSPAYVPFELAIVDAALKVASISSSSSNDGRRDLMMDTEVLSFIQSLNIHFSNPAINPLQVLESLAAKCGEGCGRGLCWRIIAVVKAAKVLGLTFSEAFEKRPIEVLQLLSLKAQDSLEEARLLVHTHFMPPASIARILAESFLKGLLAAHRGGYIDSQKEEGPAPLLWRFSDFLRWAELCPSEPEIGHALMRLVMTGQEIPHACEVELLILSHHFYKSSACLDGVDVLVTLAANRVESYVLEGDFSCLARLVTGVSNFHALNFILNILIENGQLELLLNKYTTPDTVAGSSQSIRGFRMAVLTSLKIFNPLDLNSFAMAYAHFDMKHETASLLESRSLQHMHQWLSHPDRDRQTEELLEAMRFLIEAAEVFSSIDAGHKARYACARAALLFLQIRIPDLTWIELSETNARRALVEQSRFQVALVVAEAYGLNQPNEWAPVLWNQMLRPDLLEEFVTEFVLVLPLHPSMLLELARFYRSEVAARVDQSHFSVWLSPGGLPAEWVKHLGRSFRSLLKRTRDLRLRVQLATTATGFEDVINACVKVLDKVPDNAGPLILRRGHGGAYVALM